MLELPKHVLEKLRCVKCGCYLSCGPIVIYQENEQLCGRCFKILPDDVKAVCVREIGLEAVAEVLTFPCKYNIQGCTQVFPYNMSGEHEISCQHRNNSLSLFHNNNTISNIYTYQAKDVEMKINCENTYNFEGEGKFKLNAELTGRNSNKLYLGNSSNNIKLKLEIVVSSDVSPVVTYGHVFVEKQVDEPVYDTVYSLHAVKCANCQKNIAKTEIFHCPFGHMLCKFCKSSACVICGALPNSGSQHYCKNYVKGCTNLFPTCDINKHEIDCEFNDFKCNLCEFADVLNNLISHYVQNHDVLCSKELVVNLTRKDQEWYFYCHNKLFHCKYYNFDHSIEFIVIYTGSNDNATKYKYEINLLSEYCKNITKKSKCLGWNDVSLEKGVTFELDNSLRKNLQARITIL